MENTKHPKDMTINPENLTAAYQAVQKAIIKEIWKDESLRAKMTQDPKGTIEKIVGHKFDDKLKVRVVDAQENTVTFFLPHNKEKVLGKGEFSDIQLDAVAGGFNQQAFNISMGVLGTATQIASMFLI